MWKFADYLCLGAFMAMAILGYFGITDPTYSLFSKDTYFILWSIFWTGVLVKE